jgi:hypothetical protein
VAACASGRNAARHAAGNRVITVRSSGSGRCGGYMCAAVGDAQGGSAGGRAAAVAGLIAAGPRSRLSFGVRHALVRSSTACRSQRTLP